MILDTLSNASTYEKLHSSFSRAFEWLDSYNPATPDGRYEIGDDSLIATIPKQIQ